MAKFRYPKIAGFIISVIFAYIIFSNPYVNSFIAGLGDLGYLGSLIAGILYTFGFTSPFSAGFFIDLNPSNIILTGIIAGFGALIGDMFIFEMIRFSFEDEFKRLRNTGIIKNLNLFFRNLLGKRINSAVSYIIAAIFISSPLPDEAGITLIAGLTKIKLRAMAAISFILNTIGILILFSI